jgi:hypothetical protein
MNATAEQVEAGRAVYLKSQIMKNPLYGTWKLNIGKSMTEPGPLVRSEVRTYEAAGDGGLKLVVQGTDATGAAYTYSAAGEIDGTDCPMVGSGTRNGADSTSWMRINSNTFDSTVKKGANVVNLARIEVSKDGRVLTIRERGTNASGAATRGVRTYDKQ